MPKSGGHNFFWKQSEGNESRFADAVERVADDVFRLPADALSYSCMHLVRCLARKGDIDNSDTTKRA